MKFTRSNFKQAKRSAKCLLDAFWEQREENADLQKKYDLLMDDYVECLRARVDFMYEVAESRLAEIDQFIEKGKSDLEYLSREGLEVRFIICKYRQN